MGSIAAEEVTYVVLSSELALPVRLMVAEPKVPGPANLFFDGEGFVCCGAVDRASKDGSSKKDVKNSTL